VCEKERAKQRLVLNSVYLRVCVCVCVCV
jgi:hypothetical protein